jgi:hypothetical protein
MRSTLNHVILTHFGACSWRSLEFLVFNQLNHLVLSVSLICSAAPMATLTRSTKPGSEWTINELRAYNITVTPQADDITTFFGIPTLPQPSVNQVILNNEKYPSDGIADRDDQTFFFHLERVMELEEESANFTMHLLGLLGYEVSNRFVHQWKDIHFFVCRGQTHAQTNVSLVDRNHGILLMMQEDKSHLTGMDPEP